MIRVHGNLLILNTQRKGLKFGLCIIHYHMEGSVSQNFYLGIKFFVLLEN